MATLSGAARLDGWAAGQYQRFANTAAGVAELLAFCRERRSGWW
ncbi:hypothetical protein [Sphingomonas folli]|nr:hypothetical protein [Sphingomonas folli]